MKSYSILPANICFFQNSRRHNHIFEYPHITQLNVSNVPLQNVSLDTPLTFRVKPL